MKKIFNTIIFILFLLIPLAGCAPKQVAKMSPLKQAIGEGDINAFRDLLNKGANVNESVLCDDLAGLSYGSFPLLICAAGYGNNDAIKLLLDKGVDINTKSTFGWTALSSAAYEGKTKTAQLLIDRGADVDVAAALLESYATKFLNQSSAPYIDYKLALKLLGKYAKKPELAQPVPISSVNTNEPRSSSFIKSDVDEIPQLASPPANNSYAVIIGIESYRGLPKSSFSKQDAVLMKAYLKVFGFEERNIELLTDERASKTDIEKSLEAWLPNRVKKDSTVFIYYSGHGSPDPASGEAYIVPYDGDPNYLVVTGYSLKRLYETLGKLNAREVVVVLDSCFSGAGGRSVLAQGARPLVMMTETTILSSNMAILTATQGSQISTSSPERGHGIFTYYFLKALKDGKKNIAEIYKYIKPQVEDEAKILNVQQSPSLNPGIEKITGRFSLRK